MAAHDVWDPLEACVPWGLGIRISSRLGMSYIPDSASRWMSVNVELQIVRRRRLVRLIFETAFGYNSVPGSETSQLLGSASRAARSPRTNRARGHLIFPHPDARTKPSLPQCGGASRVGTSMYLQDLENCGFVRIVVAAQRFPL